MDAPPGRTRIPAGGSTGSTGSTGSSGSTGAPIFDVGTTEDLCGCQRSSIWIANSAESTVSKLDTQTLLEAGRYITRPDAAGNPSRTSVSFTGDVAVAKGGSYVRI